MHSPFRGSDCCNNVLKTSQDLFAHLSRISTKVGDTTVNEGLMSPYREILLHRFLIISPILSIHTNQFFINWDIKRLLYRFLLLLYDIFIRDIGERKRQIFVDISRVTNSRNTILD